MDKKACIVGLSPCAGSPVACRDERKTGCQADEPKGNCIEPDTLGE